MEKGTTGAVLDSEEGVWRSGIDGDGLCDLTEIGGRAIMRQVEIEIRPPHGKGLASPIGASHLRKRNSKMQLNLTLVFLQTLASCVLPSIGRLPLLALSCLSAHSNSLEAENRFDEFRTSCKQFLKPEM